MKEYIHRNSKGEIIQKSKRNWIYTCGICHGNGWFDKTKSKGAENGG